MHLLYIEVVLGCIDHAETRAVNVQKAHQTDDKHQDEEYPVKVENQTSVEFHVLTASKPRFP